jgi:uncharacterized protein (TIGR02145 family)
MKKISAIWVIAIWTSILWAQSPEKMSYQAVIRNSSNALVTNKAVGMRISILQGSATGSAVYVETQRPTSNANGLVSVEIGSGTTSGNFSTINWADGPYFIKTETDPNGATSYTNTGTSQLLSVPYALHAKTADSLSGGVTETDPLFSASLANSISVSDTAKWNNKSNFSGNYNDLVNKPNIIDSLNTYGFSGNYSDLSGKPNIKDSIQSFGFSGNYSDLTNKPTLWDSSYFSIKFTPDLNLYATKNMMFQNITNVAEPVDAHDVATKAYVDELKRTVSDLQNTMKAGGMVFDTVGNSYYTVIIGTQTWMSENLRTTKYNDGTDIPLVTDNTAWSNLTTPGYCWYNNNQGAYSNPYGALYNFYTVNTGKLCPTGWRVPTSAEWSALSTFLGGNTVAGGKLKETGTVHWTTPNTGATDEVSFHGLPAGYRNTDGSMGYLGTYTDLWSSSETTATVAAGFTLVYNTTTFNLNGFLKKLGFAVRCIKD